MSNSHSVDCAKAVITSPTECKCQCGGAFHGGPNTARARALLREQDQKKYSKRQVSDAKRKARTAAGNSASSSLKTRAYTDYIGFSTIDGLIRVGSSQDQQKTRDFIGTVVMPFAAEINVSTLDSQQKKLVKDFVFQQHILCTHRGLFKIPPSRIKHQPPNHRKHPPIHAQRPPETCMQNPPRLDLRDNPLHHRSA